MTPRQREEITRIKRRLQVLEWMQRRRSKAAVDRLIWLVHEIEAKPTTERFVKVRLSASDGKLLRRLVEGLVGPPAGKGRL